MVFGCGENSVKENAYKPNTLLSIPLAGTNYYVSTSGSNSNNGTSPSTPWQTMSKVQSMAGTINAGDSVLFKKGDHFVGQIYWTETGSAGNPIVFGSYGSGNKPTFEYTAGTGTSLLGRAEFYIENANYIVFEGLNITDLGIAASPSQIADKNMNAYLGYGFNLANSDHCTIKDCDISYVGMGIAVEYSDYTTIQDNTIANLKNMKNTYSATFPGNDDDFGANGLTINHSNYTAVTGNYFDGNWAGSADYGFNGGACEMFGSCSNNTFTKNTVINCGGVSEFGSSDGGNSVNNEFSYNKIINSGCLSYLNLSGTFAIQVWQNKWYNNTIISNARDTFVNGYYGLPQMTDHGVQPYLFLYGGTPASDTVFNLKNNIFYLSSGIDIKNTGNSVSKFVHQNNCYRLFTGSVTNFSLGSGEVYTSAAVFVSTTGDPSAWDLHLSGSAAAINLGQNLSFSTDFEGSSVSDPPEAGVYEYGGVVSAPPSITSSNLASGIVGVSFTYQITATNSPTSYNATPLPLGLSVNTGTGAITGTPTTAGITTTTLSATNSDGTGNKSLQITISTNTTTPVIRKKKRNRWW